MTQKATLEKARAALNAVICDKLDETANIFLTDPVIARYPAADGDHNYAIVEVFRTKGVACVADRNGFWWEADKVADTDSARDLIMAILEALI